MEQIAPRKIFLAAFAFAFGVGVVMWALRANFATLKSYMDQTPNGETTSLEKESTRLFYSSIGGEIGEIAGAEKQPIEATPRFTVELKVVNHQQEANESLANFEAQGIKAFYTPVWEQGKVLYKIRDGIFASREEADAQARSVSKKFGQLNPQVVVLE